MYMNLCHLSEIKLQVELHYLFVINPPTKTISQLLGSAQRRWHGTLDNKTSNSMPHSINEIG